MPPISTRQGLIGISPVVLFLFLYVAVSLATGDFYSMPFSVALLVASVWAVACYKEPVGKSIEVYSKSAGHANILYMIWIFVLAGAFAALARECGAVDATVAMVLWLMPASLIVPGIFIAACFISLAVGTSVGTVVALAPLAASMAASTAVPVAFMVAVVIGGAFFGDNLSFISDTTIAATRSQGCDMADKFKTNVRIAVPAALVTLAIYFFQSPDTAAVPAPEIAPSDMWLVVPYLIVIVTAIARVNVTVVLLTGILAALVVGACRGFSILALCGFMGGGIDGMGGLIVITLMSAGMLGLVKALGGITWLLQIITARIHGRRMAQLCMALLVGLVNLCTANNTVAIITVGSLSRDIAERFGVSRQRAASILDTSSCIVQCIIPYGAQTLLACSLTGLSPAEPFVYLYYPWALAVMVLVSILKK